MNRTAGYCILAAAVAAAAIDCGAAARADGGVKLVNYGSYLPGLEDLATNVAAYEAEAPFDGAMFHIASSSAVFSHKPYTPEDRAEIEAAAKVYASIPFRKWSFNFLGVLIDQDCPDWFDDAYWAMVTTNWVEVAKLAKRLRMVGVCLDSEGYGVFPMNSYWTSDWWLKNRGGKGAPTRDAYRAAARRRGRQVGEALFGTYPDCILWCLYAWSLGGDLTGAFFNGLLETMPPRARLADGDEWLGYTANGEPSYAEMAARNASGCGTLDPALKAKHDAQGGLAPAFYLDNYKGGPTPPARRIEQFALNLGYAKRYATSGFVWIYGEERSWWKSTGRTWDEEMPGIRKALFPDDPEARPFAGAFVDASADKGLSVAVTPAERRDDVRVTVTEKDAPFVCWEMRDQNDRDRLSHSFARKVNEPVSFQARTAQRIVYVAPSAAGTGDGSSWANACGDLQRAVDRAGEKGVPALICLRAGTYDVTNTVFVRNLPAPVVLRGGYSGRGQERGGETVLVRRAVDSIVFVENTWAGVESVVFSNPDAFTSGSVCGAFFRYSSIGLIRRCRFEGFARPHVHEADCSVVVEEPQADRRTIPPPAETRGEACEPPKLPEKYVVEGALSSVAVPLDGWKLVWPSAREDGTDVSKYDAGYVSATVTNMPVRGVVKPVLRLEFAHGSFGEDAYPVLERDFSWNAEDYNVISFTARIDLPAGADRLIHDSKPVQGWFSQTLHTYFDDFGLSAYDGVMYTWSGLCWSATDFKSHWLGETRGADGFADFVWDVPHEERFSYKGFLNDRVKALELQYDTRKIRPGEKVVVYVADLKVTRGAHVRFDEPDLYAGWKAWVNDYVPDLSDSSKYLEPPEEGRLAADERVPLARNGKALAEIVVDLSDRILIDNWFAKDKWNFLIRDTRGKESRFAREAAVELQRWLKVLTGADFPVVQEPTAAKNAKIYLGAGFAARHFADDLARLADGTDGEDGYSIRAKDGDVYIFGAHPLGTRHGVFTFLENNSDLIFAFPGGPDGAVFTEDPNLTVVWAGGVEKPAFRLREVGGGGGFARENRLNIGREDGISFGGGHYFSPQYYDQSEGIQRFNPVIRGEKVRTWGESRTLCCLAEPGFLERQLESIPNLRNLLYEGQNPFGCIFGVDDNFGACECPRCAAPRTACDGTRLDPKEDLGTFYGAWFWEHINRMDDAVQKVAPGHVTTPFAYFFAHAYPKVRLNPNVAAMICNYYRKSWNEPIWAPVNAGWWKAYRDWNADGRFCSLYEYYGIGLKDQPVAEVIQRDLQAQRSIGFLFHATEGEGAPVVAADDRWCVDRLMWNPDADVEQLHRYFNRRTYREAAPWVDRYRGRIRTCWYRHFPGAHHLNDNDDVWRMAELFGLKDELLGYLREGLKAVRHPRAKRAMEKLLADATYASDWRRFADAWPSGEMGPRTEWAACPRDIPGADDALRAALEGAGALAEKGELEACTNALVTALNANLLASDGAARDELVRILGTLVRNCPRADAALAVGVYRANNRDGFRRANGWSRMMHGWYEGVYNMEALAAAFFDRGSPDEAAKVYDAWADFDGDRLPVGLRQQRLNAKVDAFRSRGLDISAFEKEYMTGLRRTTTEGADCLERGRAKLRLAAELRAGKSVDGRLADLFEVIDDRMAATDLRCRAARTIPEVCADGGATNWTKVAAATLRALKAGDWSGQWRTTYHRGNETDLRLDTLLLAVEAMAKAGERARAAKLLEEGAAAIGYTADATAESLDGQPNEDFARRVAKLDEAMAKFGVRRR